MKRREKKKKVYDQAIKKKCMECRGSGLKQLPTSFCHGCSLESLNTPKKRQQVSRTRIRELLATECRECCGGFHGASKDCCSNECPLYKILEEV